MLPRSPRAKASRKRARTLPRRWSRWSRRHCVPCARAREAHRRDRGGIRPGSFGRRCPEGTTPRRAGGRCLMRDGRPAECRWVAGPGRVEDRALRVDDAHPRRVAAEAGVAADRRARPAGSGSPTTIHSGTGCRSSAIWPKIDSAMLLLPRQSVACSAKVNWSRKCPLCSAASRCASSYTVVASSTRRHDPPSASISAIFSGLVEVGMTATNGRPRNRAKYAWTQPSSRWRPRRLSSAP